MSIIWIVILIGHLLTIVGDVSKNVEKHADVVWEKEDYDDQSKGLEEIFYPDLRHNFVIVLVLVVFEFFIVASSYESPLKDDMNEPRELSCA